MSYIDPSEDIKKIVREEHPDASEEQIKKAIEDVKNDFIDLLMDQIEKIMAASAKEVDLPSENHSRQRYKSDISKASRFRTKIRTLKIEDANLKRKMVAELESWRLICDDKGDTQKSRAFADEISRLDQASSTTQNVLSHIESDVSDDINKGKKSEERTDRMLRGLSTNADEE
jgi:hypothetical protein